MTAKFVVKTGNLSATIAATVTVHDSRTTFNQYVKNATPVAGSRFCFIGYRITDKAKAKAEKDNTELPQNFSIVVPVIDGSKVDAEKFATFQRDLLNDYQDKMLHKVADKDSTIDATDLAVLIADYYDTSRNRDGFTQAQVLKWYDDVFSPAYAARILVRNEENKASGKGKIQTDKETTAILANNRSYYKDLSKVESGLDPLFIKNAVSTLERLLEDEHLAADDEIAAFMLECANAANEKIAQYIEMGV